MLSFEQPLLFLLFDPNWHSSAANLATYVSTFPQITALLDTCIQVGTFYLNRHSFGRRNCISANFTAGCSFCWRYLC